LSLPEHKPESPHSIELPIPICKCSP